MARYLIHGMTVESEIELPAMPSTGQPDVEVFLGAGPPRREDSDWRLLAQRDEPHRFRVLQNSDEVLVNLGGVQFLIDAASMRILVFEIGSVPRELTSLLVVGVGLIVLLTIRGGLVLHASAACAGRGAVAVLGRPGAGKSTLVSSLVAGNWELLADDALHVAPAAPGWIAHVGAVEVRLRPHADATARMVEARNRHTSFDGRFAVRPTRVCTAPSAPLVKLVFPRFVDSHSSLSVVRIREQEAAIRVLRNLRVGSWCAPELLQAQTMKIAELARAVPAWEVRLPRNAHPPDGQGIALAAALKDAG